MTVQAVTHGESLELSGLYVLDALTSEEKQAVDAHLQVCAEPHPDFEELGAVVPALAFIAKPVPPPPSLKASVLAAYRADAGAPPAAATKPWSMNLGDSMGATRSNASAFRVPAWMGWAAAGAAAIVLAVVGVWALNTRADLDRASRQAQEMTQAIAALSAPGSKVAILHGTGAAADVNGFVAFAPSTSGSGYMVMTDVPAAPSGMTYQAWYIVDGNPVSVGTMSADPDGKIVAAGLQPLNGASTVAVTVEPAGGSQQPTSQPIIVGEVNAQS